MRIQIKGIRDADDVTRERLVLQVTEPTDIGRYLVGRSEAVGENQVSNDLRQIFWFPDKPVRPGDLVILYSKVGTANEKNNARGSTSHFFYWGKIAAVWDEVSAAVLIRAADWAMARPNAAEHSVK